MSPVTYCLTGKQKRPRSHWKISCINAVLLLGIQTSLNSMNRSFFHFQFLHHLNQTLPLTGESKLISHPRPQAPLHTSSLLQKSYTAMKWESSNAGGYQISYISVQEWSTKSEVLSSFLVPPEGHMISCIKAEVSPKGHSSSITGRTGGTCCRHVTRTSEGYQEAKCYSPCHHSWSACPLGN